MDKLMYRYADVLDQSGVLLVLHSYHVVKETECYCWVRRYGTKAPERKDLFDNEVKLGLIKKVRKGAERSFCHVDKTGAFLAYRRRKHNQARILESLTARCEQASLFLATEGIEARVTESDYTFINMGKHAVHKKYTFMEV